MNIFYKSERIGKNGNPFFMWKFRTLKAGSDSKMFAENYTRFGRLLRKVKLDELPQLVNVLRGEMSIFGYRPEEKRTWDILPDSIKEILIKQKPGIIDLSSIYFIDEERLINLSKDPQEVYWQKIKPIKFILQAFYIENKSLLFNLAILWMFFKKLLKL